MTYRLGVDLGTTNTVAAAQRDGAPVELLTVDGPGQVLPSVLFRTEDGHYLAGAEAARRGQSDPSRLATGFVGKVGEDVQVPIAGDEVAPEVLVVELLHAVLRQAAARFGGPPAETVVTCPAHWTSYRLEVLDRTLTEAGIGAVRRCSSAEAAAAAYAMRQPVEVGARIGIYDLGGGGCDVAVLQRTAAGFRLLGSASASEPAGSDFDEAVYRLVLGGLGDRGRDLDTASPEVAAALGRLRRDCVEAKESLSTTASARVPVALPGYSTSVGLSRTEFELLIRPALRKSAGLVNQALASAQLHPSDLSALVLVGGSSRIPAVATALRRELEITAIVSSQPDLDVAMGALLVTPSGTTAVVSGSELVEAGERPALGPPVGAVPPSAAPAVAGPPAAGPPAAGPPVATASAAVQPPVTVRSAVDASERTQPESAPSPVAPTLVPRPVAAPVVVPAAAPASIPSAPLVAATLASRTQPTAPPWFAVPEEDVTTEPRPAAVPPPWNAPAPQPWNGPTSPLWSAAAPPPWTAAAPPPWSAPVSPASAATPYRPPTPASWPSADEPQPVAAYALASAPAQAGASPYPPHQPPPNQPPPNQPRPPQQYPPRPPNQPAPYPQGQPPPYPPQRPGQPQGRPGPMPQPYGGGGPGGGGGFPPGPYGPGPGSGSSGSRRKVILIIAAAVVVVALAVGIGVLVVRRGHNPVIAATPGGVTAPPGLSSAPVTPSASPATASPTATPSGSPSPTPGSSSSLAQNLPASAPLGPTIMVVPLGKGDKVERNLFLVDEAKKVPRVKLATPGGLASNPMMNPGRTTIIYLNDSIFRVMAADGSGDRELFDSNPEGCDLVRHASWSQSEPNQLLVQCQTVKGKKKTGPDTLLVVGLDGQIIRRLDVGKSTIEDSSISPDGQTVLYWASNSPTIDGGSIYTIPIVGTGKPKKLTDVPVGTDGDPAFSPDGSQIAFRRRVPDGTEMGNYDIYVMNPNGSGVRPVATSPAEDLKPTWSPDDKDLLVISNRKSANGGAGKTFDLWVIRVADGQVLTSLGLKSKSLTTPFWTYR